MNKILILLIAVSCSLGMNAQSKKDLEKAIESLNKQKAELNAQYQALQSSNARIENRKFDTESPDQSLRRRLAYYKDIKEMAERNIFKRTEYQNLPISKSYISLIKMYNSLSKNGGYNQDENEAFKNELDIIKKHILSMDPKHEKSFIQSFDDLENCIRNYRFAMFELARLFDLAKEKEESEKMERAGLYKSLQEDEETDFVDKIPYTREVLINYTKGDDSTRAGIIKVLKNSCKEAFENFKE